MIPQSQQQLPPIPQPSNLLKILTCFLLAGIGVAIGTMFSSYITRTVPFFSLQSIQLPPPSTIPTAVPIDSEPLQEPTQPIQEPTLPIQQDQTQELPEPIQEPTQPIREDQIQELPEPIQEPTQPIQEEPTQEPAQLTQQEPIQEPLMQQEPPQPINQESLSRQRLGVGDYLSPRDVMHNMSDKELLRRASMVPKVPMHPYRRVPKVAFMFLARGELPLRPLWEMFFRGHEGLYNIYLHLSPKYNGTVPRDSVFFGRRIPSKPVSWGQVNMMEAERRLLGNALLDFSNERFVLLSESCVPLWNFPTIYSYLVNSTETFVKVYDDPTKTGRGRYSRHMSPQIKARQWRKSSQWFEVDRKLAIEIISDNVYFPVFKKYCRGGCYVDEHYLPTLINIKFGAWNSNRSVTWVNWSIGGPHPARYIRNQVTPELIEEMREGDEGTCMYNGHPTRVCYLFARKFLSNSLIRFQKFAPKVMGFGDKKDRWTRGGAGDGEEEVVE